MREPWDGRSPRDLTKIHILLSSRREPPKARVVLPMDEVHELFNEAKTGRRSGYSGAQLLLPFPEEEVS